MKSSDNKELLPLQYIKGIGPKRAEALAKDGIHDVHDLLYYFPRDYILRAGVLSLQALAVRLRSELSLLDNTDSIPNSYSINKKEVSIVARVIEKSEKQWGKNKKLLKVTISDESGGRAYLNFWNYVDYYSKIFQQNVLIIVSGYCELDDRGKIIFTHPEVELFDDEESNEYFDGKILPIYRLTQNLKNSYIKTKNLRQIITSIIEQELPKIEETLPLEILQRNKLPGLKDSISELHFPRSHANLNQSRIRMKFEEIFYFELFLALRKKHFEFINKAPSFDIKSTTGRNLYDKLPFDLTKDQKKVIREIADDMKSGHAMNRLLQGDVGSGKTIVALFSMLICIDNNFQSLLMAPTEILAEQHYLTFSKYLEEFGIEIVLLTGSLSQAKRRDILNNISNGITKIIIGTHTLFESNINYKNLGLIIIDEQHRFGVAQRAELQKLAHRSLDGQNLHPHVLVMSATPIPRTLTMTIYGDLELSIIKTLPKNRMPIKTGILFESRLLEAYEFIKNELRKGRQAFIVYPLVEKSEKMLLKSAVEHYDLLKETYFPEFSLGLLHGQLSWQEKELIMQEFLNKKYDILISTTVIEVGIDVSNATVMVIENAERFGLSQLHQLRGRIGRGNHESYCFLVTKDRFKFIINNKLSDKDNSYNAAKRLKTMVETNDGFRIAEVDMEIRGPGDLSGTKQIGMPEFKFIDLCEDSNIIEQAHQIAMDIVISDPNLIRTENKILKKNIDKRSDSDFNFFGIA